MGTPQRQKTNGNTGGEGPEEPAEKLDAAPKPKPADAKQADPAPTPDARVTAPDVSGPPAVDAKPVAADTAPAMTADTGPAAVTFTELWMTVFGTVGQPSSCAGAACHNPGVKDMVNMADKAKAYASLTRTGGPVVKGNPTASKLVTRLISTNVMQRMPLGKPALSKDLVDKVRAWIAAGANND